MPTVPAMSDLELEPGVIGLLPDDLREQQAALTAAATLPAPDTGASTAATAAAVRGLSGRLADLADAVDASLTTYADSERVVEQSFGFATGWWR